jgi:exosortase C (VPDSG-CTERM-specific)
MRAMFNHPYHLRKNMASSDPSNISTDSKRARLVSAPATVAVPRSRWGGPLTRLAVLSGVLMICFIVPLYDLAGFSTHSEFFSYIPLMPLITGYLIWVRRDKIPGDYRPSWSAAAATAAAGLAILAAYGWAAYGGWIPLDEDYLAIMMTSLLLLLLAAGFASVGPRTLAAVAFPLSMLIFVIPYPDSVLNGIESFFQQTSAVTAGGMLHLAGTHVSRSALELTLPDVLPSAGHPDQGLTMMVAPECSGIQSSQVLLITSLLAGHLFLRSRWKRVMLAVFVIPLAIARNGFRIFTIGELCVHVSGTMIDSPIHHKGGPIFFALSLIPFFMFVVWLRKSESKPRNAVQYLDET